MAGYHPYIGRSPGWPRRHWSFLLIVALACLTAFYAFGRRHVARLRVDREQAELGAPIIGRAFVVDGDSLRVAGVSIRLEGIDAPEWDQTCTDPNGRTWRCGLAASRQMREHVRGYELTCRPRAHDRYGRTVATCALPNGSDVNAWIVRQGFAIASGYSHIYTAEEAEAKADKRGIWSGTFIDPAEWRRQKSDRPRHRWGWWN
ncbi:MAG TPA: thermonuclease family protein [Xanthobacteraceae bacterium]|nr:thermonuclease family protein [Xanthobacteraceae bacterium]